MVQCHQINCRPPFSSLELTAITVCPQPHPQLQEIFLESRFLFSVLVGTSLSLARTVMVTGGTDAGGPEGISQLLILKDVMEKFSKDENGDSQGIVKRPCDVFDMIGGVGTGGSV
jgi:hypothetical protein